ncbi:MAG: riboflavin synthase [Verrucomicrobiia bacterium]|jgi:riboflavin synthase
MFTGIVEETEKVRAIEIQADGKRLVVRMKKCAAGLKKGDSVAVNGCCLTVVRQQRGKTFTDVSFDLLNETWSLTNFKDLSVGTLVNLERSLTPNGRLGGHFVTGHIDGVGRIRKWNRQGEDHILEITAPAAVLRYVIMKGSIAVDGMSLTVAGVGKTWFRLWIIPHTFEVTNLRNRKVGEELNLEADMIGKYVEKFTRTK